LGAIKPKGLNKIAKIRKENLQSSLQKGLMIVSLLPVAAGNVIRVLYHRLMFHYNRLIICHSRLVIREIRKKIPRFFLILVSIIQWFSFFKFWRIFYSIQLKFQTDVPNNKSVMSIKFTHNIFFLLISILFPET
jgi:hypothetical protein